MPRTVFALALAVALPVLIGARLPHDGAGGWGQITSMTFHERIIIRVPRLSVPPPQPVVWKESRGPKCINPNELAGWIVSQPSQVDLVLTDKHRVRAHLTDECELLDFYSGFYLKPAADGKVCAGRDVIRTRSGRSCGIQSYRTLKPVKPKR